MAPKIFFIGATGHIGGAVLDLITRTYPDFGITALVRSAKSAAELEKRYPNVTTVPGSLEDVEVVEKNSVGARIVLNCGPDTPLEAGVSAILRGLGATKQESYYIHTSGASSLWDEPNGDIEGRLWDDIKDIQEILDLPEGTTHKITDTIVLRQENSLVHTAIVAPPFVLGLSPSVGHPTPITFPDIIAVIQEMESSFTISKGLNRTCFVHVEDLANLFLALFEDALKSLGHPVAPQAARNTDESVPKWGLHGYYLLMAKEMTFKEYIENEMIPALRKHDAPFVKAGAKTQPLTIERAQEIIMKRYGGAESAELWTGHIAQGLGVAMRVRGSRAEKALGVTATKTDLGMDEAVKVFLESFAR